MNWDLYITPETLDEYLRTTEDKMFYRFVNKKGHASVYSDIYINIQNNHVFSIKDLLGSYTPDEVLNLYLFLCKNPDFIRSEVNSVIHRFVNKHNSSLWYEIEEKIDGKFMIRGDHNPNWVEYYLATPATQKIKDLKHCGDWYYTVTHTTYETPANMYVDLPDDYMSSSSDRKCVCEWRDVYMKGCQCGGK